MLLVVWAEKYGEFKTFDLEKQKNKNKDNIVSILNTALWQYSCVHGSKHANNAHKLMFNRCHVACVIMQVPYQYAYCDLKQHFARHYLKICRVHNRIFYLVLDFA